MSILNTVISFEYHVKSQYLIILDETERKLVPVPVESDSDLGTMTGDTDTEADRLDIVRSEGTTMEIMEVMKMEDGVMENISEAAEEADESEDEVTQVEENKVRKLSVFTMCYRRIDKYTW